MISVNSFITDTLNTVDAVIGEFVNHAYTNFVQANSVLITSLLTFYIMMMGYQFLSHSHHFNLNVVIRRLIIMLCVYGLVMNWHLYNLFVYNIFTNEPNQIAKVLIESAGNYQIGGDVTQTLNMIYANVFTASMQLFGQVNFSGSGLAFILYGAIVYIIGMAMCVYALLLFIYAKMMMAVSLALGPLFILFVLWEPTKGLFSAWLNKLVTIALIPIVTSTVLALMLSVVSVTLPALNQPAENLQFYGIAPFLGLSLATTLILMQVLRICGALGGGITLVGLSVGTQLASSVLHQSGIVPAAKATANLVSNNTSNNTRYKKPSIPRNRP